MRRVVPVLLLLLAVALLAWFALSGGPSAPGRDDGDPAEGPADAAEATPEGATKRKLRDRAGGAADAADDAASSPFHAEWPEIGQDAEQDPSLGAIVGRVRVTRQTPARDGVAEASVRGVPVARAKLRARGEFVLKNVPPGAAVGVTARAEGYAPGGVDKLLVRAGETFDVGTVYLGAALDPDVDNRVEVRVSAEGNPVAGAEVTVTSVFYGALLTLGHLEKQPGGTVLRAVTDAQGAAVFERLPPASYDVFAEADGLSFEVRQRFLVQRSTKTTVTLDLVPALTISGVATTVEGAPVKGARVACLRWGSFTNVPPSATDEAGRFTVRGLTQGNYFIVVAHPELGAKDTQNVPAGTQDLAVTIESGGDLLVRALDATTNAPLGAFAVRPFRKVPFAYLYAPLFEVKAPDGVGRVRLPASDYGMEVSADGYALANVTTVPFPSKEPYEVKLEPAGAVRGRVVGAVSGKPVRGAQVYVKRGGFPPTKVKDQQSVTDADGVFVLDHMPLRPFSLWISHVDHTEQSFDGVVPEAGTPAAGAAAPPPREFALGEGGRVEGRVLGAGGVPVAGEAIQLSAGFDFMSARSATTGADGRYAFVHVPTGPKYTVSIGQFAPGRPGKSKSDVVVPEGGVVVVDFGNEQGGVRLPVRVVRDEKPLGGINLTLVSDDGGPTFEQGRSRDDGTFTFENVAPGRYILRATGAASKTLPVTVAAGEEPPAEVVLAVVSSSIAGRVTDVVTGKPLSGAWVECDLVVDATGSSLADLVRRRKGQTTTSADGVFRFQGLEEGTYEVRGTRDGYGTEVSEPVALAAGGAAEGVTLKMGPACTLSGTVRNGAGVPLEGASITLRDSRGRQVFLISLTQSSSDGTYTQATLRPETYEVTIEKEGYAPATQRVTVSADAPGKLDVTLLQGGRIELTVFQADGAPAKDATIALFDAAGQPVRRGVTLTNIFSLQRNRTDANGRATVAGVAAGVYRVVVSPAAGDRTAERSDIQVVEAGVTPVELTLPAAE